MPVPCCRTQRILKDNTCHSLFTLLPSDRRYRSICCCYHQTVEQLLSSGCETPELIITNMNSLFLWLDYYLFIKHNRNLNHVLHIDISLILNLQSFGINFTTIFCCNLLNTFQSGFHFTSQTWNIFSHGDVRRKPLVQCLRNNSPHWVTCDPAATWRHGNNLHLCIWLICITIVKTTIYSSCSDHYLSLILLLLNYLHNYILPHCFYQHVLLAY